MISNKTPNLKQYFFQYVSGSSTNIYQLYPVCHVRVYPYRVYVCVMVHEDQGTEAAAEKQGWC